MTGVILIQDTQRCQEAGRRRKGSKCLLETKTTLYLQLKIDSMICVWFLPRFQGRIQVIESLFLLHLSDPERL